MRAPSGFIVAAVYLGVARPTPPSLAVGLAVALAGILLRSWAAGHLAKNEALARSGPFAYTRNPLYLGTLSVAAGFAMAGRSWGLAAAMGLYFAGVYLPVIREEEGHLRELFPGYAAYQVQVPRLWPRWSPAFPHAGGFRWEMWRRNREYEAVAAYLAAAAWLAARVA